MSRGDVFGPLGTRLIMNAGSAIELKAQPGQNSVSIKIITGGTLEVGGISQSIDTSIWNLYGATGGMTAAFAPGQSFGQCYPMSAGEIYNANLSGKIVLYASGATCVVGLIFGKSSN